MTKNIELLQVLISKLCHDLAGSVSTIYNCVDLIDEDQASIKNQSRLLLSQETKNLVSKIKLYRYVYGYSNNALSITELIELLKENIPNEKMKIETSVHDSSSTIDVNIAKALFCLFTFFHDNPRKNGVIYLSCDRNMNIGLRFSSSVFEFNLQSLQIITNKNNKEEMTVRNCREFYINTLCERAGYSIIIDNDGQNNEITIRKNKEDL
ncbi:MAG: hypothetical protein J0L79_02010 [Rickettsiales bacterium]|nr:hypothetical protein [Rickettsiales bacterium]MCA0254097.1 hypothetical protein [Pseudomonadota bacterium]